MVWTIAACVPAATTIELPPELGASNGLLVAGLDGPAVVLPLVGLERRAITVAEALPQPLTVLSYDCPLLNFGVDGPIRGERQAVAPLPARGWRAQGGAAWQELSNVQDLPRVPPLPLRPSECWTFPTVESERSYSSTVRGVAMLGPEQMLVAPVRWTEEQVALEVVDLSAGVTLTATLSNDDVVAVWGAPAHRRAYTLSEGGGVSVVEQVEGRWIRRALPPAPSFYPCIVEEDGRVLLDGSPAIGGFIDGPHFELLVANRCGTLAHYDSDRGSWVCQSEVCERATGPAPSYPTVAYHRAAVRAQVEAIQPDEWWVAGLERGALGRLLRLTGTTRRQALRPISVDEELLLSFGQDGAGTIYVGSRSGWLYRSSDGILERFAFFEDRIHGIYAFRGGLIIAGENGSSRFQFQPTNPEGRCVGTDEAPLLVGKERLRFFTPLPDGRVAFLGARPGAPEPGVYGGLRIVRPEAPAAWACHGPFPREGSQFR